MHAQNRRRVAADRGFVVGGTGLVRSADLHEPASARPQTSDTRTRRRSPRARRASDRPRCRCERDECRQDAGGVGVRDAGRLRAGQRLEVGDDMVLAGNPAHRCRGSIRRPVPGDRGGGGNRVVGERSAAEGRVQHHARRVDGPAHRGAQGSTDVGGEPHRPRAPLAAVGERGPDRVDDVAAGVVLEQLRDTRLGEGGVHGGERPTRVAHRAPGPGRRPTRPRRPRRSSASRSGPGP